MQPIDFEALNNSLLSQCPDLLFAWFPAGRLHGHEFTIGDIAGNPGKSLSVNVRTGIWADFSSDHKGKDLIALYAAMKNIKMIEAARQLAGLAPVTDTPPSRPRIVEKAEIPDLMPAPENSPIPSFNDKLPNQHWFYRNEKAQIVGIVCRFNQEMGKKDVIPAIWHKGYWKWTSFPKPRILYGLDRLAAKLDAPILIVEGEKSADAAAKLLPDYVCMTWPGGCKAVKHADWALIKDRVVTIWPDNDAPGRKAADEIKERLPQAYIVPTKGDTGWDAADALADGWTTARALDFITEPIDPLPKIPLEAYEIEDERPQSRENHYFRPLGYDGDDFYFYSHLAERVVEIPRGSLASPGAMMQLAPLIWWSGAGAMTESGGIKAATAADFLVGECYAQGLFDQRKCRGRGAWEDDGRSILHMGDKLYVDGKATTLKQHKSRYFYEKRQSMDVDYHEPIKTSQAYKLLEICRLIRWEDPISAELLAGWVVIAPICGALTHRPHIYLLGPATSGKSWVLEEVINGVLGKTAFLTASKSTAAGIRQSLKSDALPVIFDEAEAEEMADRVRLQEVFDMARVSFNGDAAPIHKGTADQSGRMFMPRSCFAFASINMSMKRYADETRTTILKIKQPTRDAKMEAEKFAVLQKLTTETITPEWRGGLLARTVSLIPTIKANAKIFAHEAAIYFGSRRQGDQLGAILAGLYSLHNAGIIKPEDARDFINKREWPNQKELVEDSSHVRLWKFLMEIEVKIDGRIGTRTRTISELIDIVAGYNHDDDITISAAETDLRRKGFRFENGYVWVSNTNSWIESKLRNSEWPGKWAHTLKCIIGAIVSEAPRRFISSDRCVGVPLEIKE